MSPTVVTDLRTYNVFGMVVVKKYSIKTYVTLFNGKNKVSRVHLQDRCKLEQLTSRETVFSTFAAWIDSGSAGEPDIAQHSNLDSEAEITEIPEVMDEIQGAINQLKEFVLRS
jgi:hypothetical protein